MEVYSRRGNAHLDKSDYDLAIADFTKAIELNRNSELVYYSRGIAYLAKGDRVRAVADYTKAVEINPKYMDAYDSVLLPSTKRASTIKQGMIAEQCSDLPQRRRKSAKHKKTHVGNG